MKKRTQTDRPAAAFHAVRAARSRLAEATGTEAVDISFVRVVLAVVDVWPLVATRRLGTPHKVYRKKVWTTRQLRAALERVAA